MDCLRLQMLNIKRIVPFLLELPFGKLFLIIFLKIILVAHMDTVFPIGMTSERPFQIDGDRAYGPGVVDMKASQVELIFALQTLQHLGVKGYENVLVVLNSDEEIGSPSSRPLKKKCRLGRNTH
jgi:glutamate carboxypeptidase